MRMLRFFVPFALASLSVGCPASTTLVTDGGPGSDAGPPSWAACTMTSECELEAAGCCPPCGTPSLAEYDAVNASQHDAHFAAVCPAPIACPRCATGSNPSLVATCQASRCVGMDVSTLPLSACTSDSDCRIRYANCCSCSGTEDEVIAIRTDAEGAIEALLCDGGACALDCAPRADPAFAAVCDAATHHCAAMRVTIGP